MDFALQWKVKRAYTIAAIATSVNRPAEMRPTLSPKLSRPTAKPPRITVKLSHERNVRSFAKKTLGSTRVGSAMRLPSHSVSITLHCSYTNGLGAGSYLGRSEGGVVRTWCVFACYTDGSRPEIAFPFVRMQRGMTASARCVLSLRSVVPGPRPK